MNHPTTPLRLALFLLLLAPALLVAQEETPIIEPPAFWVGGWGGIGFVTYDVSVQGTTFDPRATAPASAPFSEGTGSGFMLGALFEYPISSSLFLGLRAGYQMHSGSLTNKYLSSSEVRGRDGSSQIGTIVGTVETDFAHLPVTLYGRVTPFDFPLYFIVGPSFLLPGTLNYTYTEEVTEPANVVFRSNGRTDRTLVKRDFTSATGAVALTAGLGYDILDLGDNLILFGEIQVQPMVSDYIDRLLLTEQWRATTTGLLVGIRKGLGGGPVAAPRPTPPPVVRDTTPVRGVDSSFVARGVTDSGLSDTLTITRRSVQSTELHALLPYVFFDRDSARLPSRYQTFDPRGRRNFSIERLPRGNTMGVYYNLLNIVGERLRTNRRVNIRLTGYMGRFETDSTLPRRRVDEVKRYLMDVWRVAERRITDSVVYGVPPNPSLSDIDPRLADLENQRVEIYSQNNIVEAPVRLPDTTLLEPLGVVRFLPPAQSPDTLEVTGGWSLDVKVGDSIIKDAVTGVGAPPTEIDFPLRPDINTRAGSVSSTLVIQDTAYNELVRVSSTPVVLRQEGAFEEERTVRDGRYVDTYTLLIYSFDSAQVAGFVYQAISIMKERIRPTSSIRILGYTDKIGLPYYNKQLSQRRADFAALVLGVQGAATQGLGERKLLYDNDTPEGRYYCRTVEVIVETPIDADNPLPEPELETPQPDESPSDEGGA